ncbi:MAG: DUF5752 family protein [Candidatus Omnitrophica bacterium]|nr:DUF5752 family protein [Candidatus Omnitrophota bacterium]
MPPSGMETPFVFYASSHISELTGLRASTLGQLLELIKDVPGASIYHHTHRFLQQHQYLSPEPPNDFSYWVADCLGDVELGEELASIDTMQFLTIRALREKITATIEKHLEADPLVKMRFARAGEEFHFIKSISFVFPTNYVAHDLDEFVQALKKVTIDSIYFHIFEARLRLEKPVNDFSNWIGSAIGDKQLADKISRLDPYTHTLEDLRNKIVYLIQKRAIKSV